MIKHLPVHESEIGFTEGRPRPPQERTPRTMIALYSLERVGTRDFGACHEDGVLRKKGATIIRWTLSS